MSRARLKKNLTSVCEIREGEACELVCFFCCGCVYVCACVCVFASVYVCLTYVCVRAS